MRLVPSPKRRRFLNPMDAEAAQAKLAAMAEEIGREIRVFMTSPPSDKTPVTSVSNAAEENDDFYEFTAEDYYRLLSTKKEDKYLKTRKIRDAEEAAKRARMTKSVIRVRFPDNHTVEAKFHPSETIQDLMNFLAKVVVRPDIPFYIYTTPPKKQLNKMSMNFYDAGFVPGAIVYFSYDLPKVGDSGIENSGPFLRDDVLSLNDLDPVPAPQQEEAVQPMPEAAVVMPLPNNTEAKSAAKKPVKPKWLKL